jgi:hypothetical protein
MLKTLAITLLSILLAATAALAQEQTPEPPPATETPTTEPVVTEAPVVVTEAPVVVTQAPVVVAPAVLDVSGVRVYFVSSNNAPVVGSPFMLDLMVTNPAAVGINSLTLQCTLDQVLFMVDPIAAPGVISENGQPVPTPIPGIFGVNPYLLPLTVDPYTNTAMLTIAQTSGIPAFASGKAESFNLRATAAGTFNLNCTASVVDANGLTQSVATFPLSMSVQSAPVVEQPTEAAPVVEQPAVVATEAAPVVEQPAAEATEAAPVVEQPTEAAPVVEVPLAEVPQTGTISGVVISHSTVTITLTDNSGITMSVVANTDGSFTINNVPAGIYTITADANGVLPAQGTVGVMPSTLVTLGTVVLVAGDLNNDNLAIDASDAAMLNSVYGMAAATLPPELDLDRDGTIGLQDLNALAANMGQAGPTLWQ